ncbi:alkylated DNA repair protein alkB homolog 8 isoform X1 [Synchiropus splendidus]|uniref:alkylated DNA repair protein alkB homolog 8 isoform X1 n=2 Tax=Synchiropus splendidus TaxID=270530 RepID=UPI00237E1996|nr:alkylated DNA repair protein alkB homolog 8 isoform X1 [Synchiropus splendidus]
MAANVENNIKAVKLSKDEKKVLRKQMKGSHTLLRHEGITTTSQPTKSLVIANGGLGNGVSREELSSVLKDFGAVDTLMLPPHKPYAFVTYSSQDSALEAFAQLNGQKLQCGEVSVTLYLSFVDSVKCKDQLSPSLPEGLLVVEDFLSQEEESLLLAAVDWSSSDCDLTVQKALKHRKVKHYGYEFRYDNNNVDKDKPLAVGIPEVCLSILDRCVTHGYINVLPDQLTVNQYEPGQGIPPHVDTHSAFEDTILSFSLGAKTVMEFRHPDGPMVNVLLPARSLLVMTGESRYLWTHGITPRKFDTVPISDPQSPAQSQGDQSNLTLSKRGVRTSFTFRKIRREPCCCAFPSACDSQKAQATSPPSPPSLPRCHADAARLEEEYVHRVYDAIASHFSSTRHSPWPRVCHFLTSLPAGSVLADVGCGNGKYLGVNPEVIAIGSDRSSTLVHICAERGFQAFVSDALRVPLRTASCDACISIAVIHHFSTPERRLAAVTELVRLLRPGGRALIYVWAFEQEFNKQKSKYLKGEEDNHNSHGMIQTEGHDSEKYKSTSKTSVNQATDGKLSVHKNRTTFNSSDLLVPWHLRDCKPGSKVGKEEVKEKILDNSSGKSCSGTRRSSESQPEGGPSPVFHRYYHVFQQGELENLCAQVPGVQVQSSYHDQGNWCVMLEKDNIL